MAKDETKTEADEATPPDTVADETETAEADDATPAVADETETAEAAEDDAEPPMAVEVSVEDVGVCKKKVSISIAREEIDKKFDESFSELQRSAMVRGFRPGHAPRRLVERRYRDDVEPEVITSLVTEGFRQAMEKEDLQIIGEPDIDPTKIKLPDEGPLVFEVGLEVRPTITLPKYMGIDLDVDRPAVSDDDIDKATERICMLHGRYDKLGEEEAAKQDDVVLGDVTITVDGKAVVDRKDSQVPVTQVAIDNIVVECLPEVLKGVKPGETRHGEFTVAEDCQREELRGKGAEIAVAVKEISRHVPAELNEELFKKVAVKDLDELKSALRRQLEADADLKYRQAQEEALYQYLLDNTPLELPEELLKRQSESMLTRQLLELQYRGVAVEAIEKRLEELRTATDERASREMKLYFILDQIAQDENIDVTDQEVDTRVKFLASRQGRREDRLRDELRRRGQLDTLKTNIRDTKVTQLLLDKANIKGLTKPAESEGPVDELADEAPRRKPPEAAESQTGGQDDEIETT
ncbi:MAG: trigger factor [Planctomycetia bacterium]|nr:trigger factor [Planctomycetia bacterium]